MMTTIQQKLTTQASLQELALEIRRHIYRDIEDARLRALGASIIRKYKVPARDPFKLARAVLLAAQAIKFFRECPEVNAAPWVTQQWGIGDCDDKSRYIAALLRHFQVPVRLVYMSFRSDKRSMAHVWPEAQIGPNHTWLALESVRPWPIGKSALDLVKRKGWPHKVFRVTI